MPRSATVGLRRAFGRRTDGEDGAFARRRRNRSAGGVWSSSAGVLLTILATIDGPSASTVLRRDRLHRLPAAGHRRRAAGPRRPRAPTSDQVDALSEGAVVDGTRIVTDGFRELDGDRWAADQFLTPCRARTAVEPDERDRHAGCPPQRRRSCSPSFAPAARRRHALEGMRVLPDAVDHRGGRRCRARRRGRPDRELAGVRRRRRAAARADLRWRTGWTRARSQR